MPCCAAVNCSNRHEKGFRLFRFPNNKTRRDLWIAKLKRDNWKPTSCSALCEAHFDENQFERNRKDGWRKLRPDAVPTLFTHSVVVHIRKPPLKRSPEESPTKTVAKKRFSSTNFSTTTTTVTASSESSTACQLHDGRQDMVNCAVPGCHSNSANSRLRFFQFPKNSHRNELWKAFTKRGDMLPNYPRLCELHFAPSQFEQNRQDGWHKLKWSAVPTLHPPVDQKRSKKKCVQECLTEKKPDTSLKLTNGEEFHNGASETSTDSSANMVAGEHLGNQQESEPKSPSTKLCTFSARRVSGTHMVRDKKVLQNLLRTIAENIQRTSFQLQETTSRKCQLMQAVKALTQEEIALQGRLKKESDKENVVKQQLQEIEDEEKDLWKEEEEPGCEELDTLIQQNEHQDMRTECSKADEPCGEEPRSLTEKDDRHGLQIVAQKEIDLVAKNILSEKSAEKQMNLKVFDGFVAFSIVDSVQIVTLKLLGDEDMTKSFLENSTNLTSTSKTEQADDLAMNAESVAENTNGVECNSSDQSTLCCVETDSLDPPPMLLEHKHICSFCGENFLNADEKQIHELKHGTDFRCDICEKVCSNRTRLIQHKSTHTDERPFGCTLCPRRFKANGSLNRHFRSHTGEKHFACSLCSERFVYAHQRQVHMSIHTGKQPYCCQECGRGFAAGNCLIRHMRIHRGEKPYECDVCGKRFRQGNQVRAHKEMHGEKPYVCYRCGKRLGAGSFWTHMKTHMKTHTLGIKVYYQCTVCDKKLSTKKTLEMHTRMVHMGEAAYVCDICYKGFGKHKDYQLHRKEHKQVSS